MLDIHLARMDATVLSMTWRKISLIREITGWLHFLLYLRHSNIFKLFNRLTRRSELSKANRVRAGLMTKQEYMRTQLEQYKTYINHCLTNLNKAGNNKRVHFASLYDETQRKGQKLRSKTALKYPATKLHEKGILQKIEGLPNNHLKNVQMIFLPLEQEGMFEISVRFMGVEMEKLALDIQELLRLQYEGQAVLDMFGKAKINVNLLLHFLNAKFYGK